ncbi:MAG: hypothetical protein IT463_05995 [Planctomycetes bacterium]|nr:hypothetical protein [Planctomycetota bacterium]
MKAGCSLALLLCALLAGCSWYDVNVYKHPNPYTEPAVTVVAVAPFLFTEKTVDLQYPFDLNGLETADGRYLKFSVDIAQQFAQELAQFQGFTVIPPADVVTAWKAGIREGEEMNPLAGAEGARALARKLKADAIVVAEVRSYDPYEYPRLELAWQMLYVGERRTGEAEIRRLERMGAGRPFPLGTDLARYPLYAADDVVDCQNDMTRRELKHYASGLTDEATGYASEEEMIRKEPWPRYFRFASWLALQRAFEYEQVREKK